MPRTTRNSLIGFLVGFSLGLTDYFLLRSLNVVMTIDGRDITVWVVLFFALNFGILGFILARVWMQKRIIARQLAELESTSAQLVASEKLATVGRVSASVAHEVRNSLGVIRSSADLIKEDVPENSDSETALDYVTTEVDRLNEFITELLEFSKPISAPLKEESITDWVAELDQTVATYNADVKVDAVATTARISKPLLTQLAVILVQNAKSHADNVTVTIDATSASLSLRVSDDGDGVAPKHQASIFEPFFTTRAKGTGLGLATAMKIAETHDATLTYLPDVGLGPNGRGATFEFEMNL